MTLNVKFQNQGKNSRKSDRVPKLNFGLNHSNRIYAAKYIEWLRRKVQQRKNE